MIVRTESQLESLLKQAIQDPLPEAHTSSYWRLHAEATDLAAFRPSGFEGLAKASHMRDIWHGIERITYRSVIARLGSYKEVWGGETTRERNEPRLGVQCLEVDNGPKHFD
jgi:hypothetical protein